MDFGRLAPGELKTADLIMVDRSEWPSGVVKFVATCRIGSYRWDKLIQAELPPRSPGIY